MAILEMKKLRLIAVRSAKAPLLRELIKHGCVEFSELEADSASAELSDFLSRESSACMTLKTQLNSINHAISICDKYVPVKKPLLASKPEVADELLLDFVGIGTQLVTAQAIEAADDRIKRICAEESRQRSIAESMQPWLNVDMKLNCTSTVYCAVLMGSFPVKINIDEVDAAIAAISDEAELCRISQDKGQYYTVLICLKDDLPAMQECLRGFAFTPSALGGMNGTARECLSAADVALRDLALEKKACITTITDNAQLRDEMKLAADKLSAKVSIAEAEDRLLGTDSVVIMEGWLPAEREEELAGIFDSYDCAWETFVPTEEEYPSVPVKLKNNFFSNALNMVTNMYSLPAYGSLDPNPLMAPFFILFYGLMMADMGYGLLMILAAVVAMLRLKPREGTLSFCQLLLYAGISTFVMGALTGGFFGNAFEQLGIILGKPEGWGVLPALFSPMKDVLTVLIGAMVLGLIHLNTGMIISFCKKCRRGQAADAFWEEGALWVTLVGIILFVLKIGNIGKLPVVLILGIAMVFYGGSRGKKGFGKLLSIFVTLYNTATGWFGDILSYSRIMALMLAGSVIATVFNTIGGIANSLWLFIPVFIIGHCLNFALNLLGCYVHDLRLQCLEYFGKFYEDGGRPFDPLEIKTKYFNVAK